MSQGSQGIWLEISNARIESVPTKTEGALTQKLQAQFKADKTDKEPTWWDVAVQGDNVESTYRLLVDAIDKKRLVLGELSFSGKTVHIARYRIQFTEISR